MVNLSSLGVHVLDASREKDIISELDAACLVEGELQPMPAAFYASRPRTELSLWCVRRGFYCLPTLELVALLHAFIGRRPAIEIGSGNGCLGRALGIPRTDSFQQAKNEMRLLYESMGQAPVVYGRDVEQMDALMAVQHYQPEVVVAAWVTHRYNKDEHYRGGNYEGVDEAALLEMPSVRHYIHVGALPTHEHKPLRQRQYHRARADFLFSRLPLPQDELWIWERES